MFREMCESASDLIQSVAPDGRFINVNRAWSMSGRGIMLSAFMDEVTFNARGNQVTLAKDNPHLPHPAPSR